MVTLATYQDVIDELPEGSSSTIIASTAWVERLMEKVEGDICSKTQFNWIDSYANVADSNKELLKSTVVQGTCFKIVNQNTTGFFSRQAAEIALDVFDDIYTRNVKTLADLDTQKLRSIPQ